ncbi:TraX protein [Allorhodopirellula heiligendammensis]|uniref:TraX protein n=2 Tax=Allorhodopirellula heiligendammensis TaxID=2714739 RepID=A0A5C6BTH2_9BACT|nr:TraX protein [Allorhodopirellula heiligendammensis]
MKRRNASMDTLRGLAIVMMVTDHVAGLLLGHSIVDSPIRLAMRLSMPLFCVLMGYYLPTRETWRARRFAEIAVTAVIVNLVFYPTYGCLDILCSLLIAGVVGVVSGRFFPIFVSAALLYPVDPSDGWPSGGPMDFPLSIVLSFVALGSLHARYGVKWACWIAAALTVFYLPATSLTPGSVSPLLFLFILPATALLALAERFPSVSIPGLQWLGRNPLKSYAVQYYVIFALSYAISRLSG